MKTIEGMLGTEEARAETFRHNKEMESLRRQSEGDRSSEKKSKQQEKEEKEQEKKDKEKEKEEGKQLANVEKNVNKYHDRLDRERQQYFAAMLKNKKVGTPIEGDVPSELDHWNDPKWGSKWRSEWKTLTGIMPPIDHVPSREETLEMMVSKGRKVGQRVVPQQVMSAPKPFNPPPTPPKQGQGKVLTPDIARQILQEVGGDKEKARVVARQRGYTF
jgi:seryl-tRNA synthetase